MIASYSTALLDRPGLLVAVAATDPVRAADLAARIALAGHRFTDEPTDADLVLADGECRTPPGIAVLRLDAADGLPLSLSPAQLHAAIRAVAVGLRVALPLRSDDPALTPRELEILAYLGDGMSNKAIARKLGISAHYREVPPRSRVHQACRWQPRRSRCQGSSPRSDHVVTRRTAPHYYCGGAIFAQAIHHFVVAVASTIEPSTPDDFGLRSITHMSPVRSTVIVRQLSGCRLRLRRLPCIHEA